MHDETQREKQGEKFWETLKKIQQFSNRKTKPEDAYSKIKIQTDKQKQTKQSIRGEMSLRYGKI